MTSAPPPKPPLDSFKAGSAAVTGRPPKPEARQPLPQAAPVATPVAVPPSSGEQAPLEPRGLELLMALEQRFQEFPLVRSRPLQDAAAQMVKVLGVSEQVLSIPAPGPITEQEVFARFAALADPYCQERERAPGEAVAMGDVVLASWEAVINDSGTLLARETQVEGRVLPDPALPGFFEGLVGNKVGARARFSSVMPEDFDEPSVRGKQVDFTVDVHRALERRPPEANSPELLRALGYDSLQAVIDALGQQAMAERTQAIERQARMRVYDLLTQGLQSVIAPEWIDQEVTEQWKAHGVLAEARGEPLEELGVWLVDPGLRSEAELRLRLNLALQALCARDKVSSGPEDERLLLEALAGEFEVGPQVLKADLTRTPVAEALLKRAAWFLRATEHVMGQVKIQLQAAPEVP